jgi:N5-(cytidine 5'-diphosphoramidyl)-L-glutamine hydrolase
MRILISQRDVRIPPSFFTFDALERSWYDFLSGHDLIPVPNLGRIDRDVDFDCLVLTGGPDSIERNQTENLLFSLALERNKPIIGFCHGAFAINDLTDGINGYIDGHVQTDHEIIMDNKIYTVNSYHGQSIDKLGPDMEKIAMDLGGYTEAFKHKYKPIYGIVWHPERMNEPVLPNDVRSILL